MTSKTVFLTTTSNTVLEDCVELECWRLPDLLRSYGAQTPIDRYFIPIQIPPDMQCERPIS
jgi:hypothetical protein